jgi:hypothetical protein
VRDSLLHYNARSNSSADRARALAQCLEEREAKEELAADNRALVELVRSLEQQLAAASGEATGQERAAEQAASAATRMAALVDPLQVRRA